MCGIILFKSPVSFSLFRVGLKYLGPITFRQTFLTKSSINVIQDVTLFKLENPKFHFYLNTFSSLQCLFWSYTSLFLFTSLKPDDPKVKEHKVLKVIISDKKYYKSLIGGLCFLFGWSIFIATLSFTARSVRTLILNKGGRSLTIITYKLPGLNNVLNVPVNDTTAVIHRSKVKTHFPLKVKNKYFYYLLDMKGEISNPSLFDFSVGVKRSI